MILLIILIFFISCVPYQQIERYEREKRGIEPYIRILIIQNPTSFTVSSDFETIVKFRNRKGSFKTELKILTSPLKIFIDKENSINNPDFPIFFEPSAGLIYINGRGYRGKFGLYKSGDNIFLINFVSIESYLKGVVPREMGRLSSEYYEALKAQAIAARTYAYKHLDYSKLYDLLPTEAHQVYGSIDDEYELSTRAVDETRGLVLTYNNEVIDARYSSTCGGRTENNEDVWDMHPLPYLRSVYDGRAGDPFCKESPHSNWEVRFGKEEFFGVAKSSIKEIYKKEIKEIRYIKISDFTMSGRVRRIELMTDKGVFFVERDKIRFLFPYEGRSLKSTLFTVQIKGDYVLVKGQGYGHGVGMCQWGAIGMAKKGYSCFDILRHYYRNVRLEKLW